MPLSRRKFASRPSSPESLAVELMLGTRTFIISFDDDGLSEHVGITLSDDPKLGGVRVDHAICSDRSWTERL